MNVRRLVDVVDGRAAFGIELVKHFIDFLWIADIDADFAFKDERQFVCKLVVQRLPCHDP